MLAWCWCFWEAVPYCMGWWLEKVFFPGVLASGVALLALWQIRVKRRGDYALEQLTKFYAPILGMSSALAAHRRGDEMLKEAGSKAHHEGWKKDVEREKSGRWAEYIESSMQTSEIIKKFFEDELPARFTNERVDMYIKMRDFFTQNFGFADEDTRVKYYGDLYDEVEKMRVYRDSVGKGSFLPGMREIIARRVDMRRLDNFHSHLEQRVRSLVQQIKRSGVLGITGRRGGMKAKDLERIREFASIVFDQAYRLLNEIGWPAKKTGVPNDIDAIDKAVMNVYRELEAAREEVDPAEWENKKVDGSRTGQDILEKLDEVLTLLHPKE